MKFAALAQEEQTRIRQGLDEEKCEEQAEQNSSENLPRVRNRRLPQTDALPLPRPQRIIDRHVDTPRLQGSAEPSAPSVFSLRRLKN